MPWLRITAGSSGNGPGDVTYTVDPNNSGAARSGGILARGVLFPISQGVAACPYAFSARTINVPAAGAGLRFVPVPPCRVADTRPEQGKTGNFGPPALPGGSVRTIAIWQSPCGVPSTAQAYSLNITVVPSGQLSFLTVWPTGAGRPVASTLNSFDGKIVANAALVPVGSNGSVDVFVTDSTHVIIDINGYFMP